jgi:hypothetical protein
MTSIFASASTKFNSDFAYDILLSGKTQERDRSCKKQGNKNEEISFQRWLAHDRWSALRGLLFP